MHLFHNPHHDGSKLYVLEQNPTLGNTARLRIAVHKSWLCSRVLLRQSDSGEAFLATAELVETKSGWQWFEADLRIANPIVNYRWFLEKQSGESYWLNAAGIHQLDRPDSEDFRITDAVRPPSWSSGAVMYQIFPDRFAKGEQAQKRTPPEWAKPAEWSEEVIGKGPGTAEQFFGGDLDGISSKLDYLSSLGVEVIYLTPFFPARSNHRYDASSFDEVDPVLGGNEALSKMIAKAHEKGFRVMGDLTSNHSGAAHEWFLKASSNHDSAERSFYYFNEDGSYESWFGVPSLPKFNWASSELRKRFIADEDSVVAKWMKKPFGLDGWRIDVANMTGRFRDQDMFSDIGTEIRQRMNQINPDSFLMAEYTSDAAPQISGHGWQGAMTYANFSKPVLRWLAKEDAEAEHTHLGPGRLGIAASEMVQTYQAFIASFPWSVRLNNMNALDTHDTPRFNWLSSLASQKVAAAMQFSIPGMPTIFAGDELGLSGWNGENSRTPMPWDGEREIDSELFEIYKALIKIRVSQSVLKTGSMRWLYANEETAVFVREDSKQSVLVSLSRNPTAVVEIPIDSLINTGIPENIFGGADLQIENNSYRIPTKAQDAQIWRISSK